MKKHPLTCFFITVLMLPLIASAQPKDELDQYIQHLKDDYLGQRKETGFLSAGADFLSGQEYFDSKNYNSAEWYFMDVVKKQKDNPFANYQLAIALLRQNNAAKTKQAQQFLNTAFSLKQSLKERYRKDMPAAAVPSPETKEPARYPATANNNNGNPDNPAGLGAYIERIKSSGATRGAETAMLSAGREALYGIEHYEANEYQSAETSFALSLAKDADNAYVNYLMAVSVAAQGNTEKAKPYLAKAVAADEALLKQYESDVAIASAKWASLVDKRTIKTTLAAKASYGGKLVVCDYTCSQSIWNGPNAIVAYRDEYKGYFALKPDGTYRWLDNGGTGRYSYDAKTGKITWLSGYFKTVDAKTTLFQNNKGSAQINVIFSDSYRWECGCKK